MRLKIKDIFSYIRKIDYRHYICVGITLIFLSLAIFYFRYGLPRLIESFIDLFNSAKYYVSELFDLNLSGKVTINDFTNQPFEMPFNLPKTWEEFKVLWKGYWQIFFTKENVVKYFDFLGDVLYYLSKILMILTPLIVLIIVIINKSEKQNNDYNMDSKALIWWKNKFEKKFYLPIKKWLKEFIIFIKTGLSIFRIRGQNIRFGIGITCRTWRW